MRRQRGNVDIDEIREASIKGGLEAIQLQGFGGGETPLGAQAVFDANGSVVAATGSVGTHSEVLVDHLGNPITTSRGDWIYVQGVPNG